MRSTELIPLVLVTAVACNFVHGSVASDARGGDSLPPPIDGGDAGMFAGACAPLPAVASPIVVSDIATLRTAIATAPAGSTIELANGTYTITQPPLAITTPGLTIRSQSGDAAAVIINGAGLPLAIKASDVTISTVTFAQSPSVAILVQPTAGSDIMGDIIYDVTFDDDIGPAVRIYPFNLNVTAGPFADNGTIACSRFKDTTAVDHCTTPVDLGIDGFGIRGWTIRNNVLDHLACPTRLVRSIWIRGGSRDTQLIANRILDSNGAITLGDLLNRPARTYSDYSRPSTCSGLGTSLPQHWGGVICDNTIAGLAAPMFAPAGYFDDGIAMWGTCDAWALHNTVVSPAGAGTASDLEFRFAGSFVHLVNNLTEMLPTPRDSGAQDPTYASSNVLYSATTDFVDATNDDLHLTAGAAETAGTSIAGLGLCATDADGMPRSASAPIVGAYER